MLPLPGWDSEHSFRVNERTLILLNFNENDFTQIENLDAVEANTLKVDLSKDILRAGEIQINSPSANGSRLLP